MTTHEAADLIEQMAKSLEDDPAQFHIELAITGTQVSVHGGGTGLNVQTTGGGAGSRTTGFSSVASTGDVRITQGKADREFRARLQEVVGTLRQIAAELRATAPDGKKIGGWVRGLAEWVPLVIRTLVQTLTAQHGGAQ
ncbi:MAG: hypothetical protein AAB290_02960 [Candidatus Eisenbacteria bacterium]